MTVTLFVFGSLIFLDAMLDSALAQIRDKVDINVYFTVEAEEPDILALTEQIRELPEVADVEYVSRNDALVEFRRENEGDQLILQALDELGENPLGAYLNVRAQETSQYASIATFLESKQETTSNGVPLIDKINYFDNKLAIDRLTSVMNSIDALSFIVMVVFIAISILIIFNTIRLAIYTAREEISVMRLVGANNAYIRGPFIVEGIMYGIISAIFALIIFYPVTIWAGPFTETFFGSRSIFDYYVDHFAQMFVLLIVTGVILGAVSSYLAVRRYLKI